MSIQLPIFEDVDVEPYYADPYAHLADLSDLFDRDHWRRQGQEIDRANKGLTDRWQWDIGDWLLLGEVFGRLTDEQLKLDAEKITKRAWKTLKNYKVVSRAFPKPSSLRRDGLSYSLYPLLTKFRDPAHKAKAINHAEDLQSHNKKRLTVDEFKKEINRLQRAKLLPPDEGDSQNGGGEQNGTGEVTIKIEAKLRQDTYDRVEAVAFRRYDKHVPNRLIWDMAFKYWGDHKEQLESMSKTDDPLLKYPNPLP
jgi:hypothetical protein